MKYITKPLSCLTEDFIRNLYEMTNSNTSLMRDVLDNFHHRKDLSAIIVKNKDEFVGWAMIIISGTDAEIMVYVKHKHRRQRIGTELIDRAIRYLKRKGRYKLYALPWDKRSYSFFKAMMFSAVENCSSINCFDYCRDVTS